MIPAMNVGIFTNLFLTFFEHTKRYKKRRHEIIKYLLNPQYSS